MASEAPAPRRALEPALKDAGIEPDSKRPKAKRQWKAGTLPDTNTPIRVGTNIKTPIRHKDDKKVIREELKEVLDVQIETVTEQVKELQVSMNDLKEKIYDLNDDAWAFRKQQLWSLKNQVKEQRAQAAKEECVVGWPADATASQRADFLNWCIQQAGIIGNFYMSHATKPGELSPMTMVSFAQPWIRTQLDKWYKDTFITPKANLYFYKDGQMTNSVIKMRPQVALWDRLKGEPLKVSMKAMGLAVDKGELQLDMSKLKPWWGQNAVYDEYYTYAWVHFSVKDVVATVYLDTMVYDAVKKNWQEAEMHVRRVASKEPRGKGKGKGKSKQFDTEHGDFPFEYKLAEVKDWKYDRGVMEHRQADADQDNQDF